MQMRPISIFTFAPFVMLLGCAEAEIYDDKATVATAPHILLANKCPEPDGRFDEQISVAELALTTFPDSLGYEIRRGAVKYLADLPCLISVEQKAKMVQALTADTWLQETTKLDLLPVLKILAGMDSRVEDKLVRIAFDPDERIEEIPTISEADIRERARVILADLPSAAQYEKQARLAMGSSDAAQTSAARVAAAGASPEVLKRIEVMLTELLSASPDPIDYVTKARIFELGYALSVAGPSAQPYSQPLIEIMDRKVESFAPPFGMLSLDPYPICDVAQAIGGELKRVASSKDYCDEEELKKLSIHRRRKNENHAKTN